MPIFDATKSLNNAVTQFRQELIDRGMTEEGADTYTDKHRAAFSVNAEGVVSVAGVPATVDDPVAHLARRTFAFAGAAVKNPPREPTEAELNAVRARLNYSL